MQCEDLSKKKIVCFSLIVDSIQLLPVSRKKQRQNVDMKQSEEFTAKKFWIIF